MRRSDEAPPEFAPLESVSFLELRLEAPVETGASAQTGEIQLSRTDSGKASGSGCSPFAFDGGNDRASREVRLQLKQKAARAEPAIDTDLGRHSLNLADRVQDICDPMSDTLEHCESEIPLLGGGAQSGEHTGGARTPPWRADPGERGEEQGFPPSDCCGQPVHVGAVFGKTQAHDPIDCRSGREDAALDGIRALTRRKPPTEGRLLAFSHLGLRLEWQRFASQAFRREDPQGNPPNDAAGEYRGGDER